MLAILSIKIQSRPWIMAKQLWNGYADGSSSHSESLWDRVDWWTDRWMDDGWMQWHRVKNNMTMGKRWNGISQQEDACWRMDGCVTSGGGEAFSIWHPAAGGTIPCPPHRSPPFRCPVISQCQRDSFDIFMSKW